MPSKALNGSFILKKHRFEAKNMKNCPQILQIYANFGLDSFPMPREAESHNQPSLYY